MTAAKHQQKRVKRHYFRPSHFLLGLAVCQVFKSHRVDYTANGSFYNLVFRFENSHLNLNLC
jgi:hypothetical protein